MISNQTPLVVIDPAVRHPELVSFNALAQRSGVATTYHLPALFGMESLNRESAAPRAIIVFGSASSVTERLAWQQPLEHWLLPHLHAGVPTLGICFGHQMIAHLFGAKVEFHHPLKEKWVGFRKVELKASRLFRQPQVGSLYYSHNEIVRAVPNGFHSLSDHSQFAVEAMEHDSLPIWTFQAHPEVVKGEGPDAAEGLAFGAKVIEQFLQQMRK